jgi:uncharacterized protein
MPCLQTIERRFKKLKTDKMNPIELLKQEHEQIERELLELEIIQEEPNLSNLTHTFKKLHEIWDRHEKKEEKLFKVLKKDKIVVPVKKMMLEHDALRKHKDAIYNAIKSGSEHEIKSVLKNNIPIILDKLRSHIADEDEILYRLTLQLFTSAELKELEKSIN